MIGAEDKGFTKKLGCFDVIMAAFQCVHPRMLKSPEALRYGLVRVDALYRRLTGGGRGRYKWLGNRAETASPRNTILGHDIGLLCGYGAFVLSVATSPPFGVLPGVHGPRVLAAALSLSATGALMALFRVSHPPAGATTLIVSLGIISHPKDLVIIEVAVVLLTVQALVINRLAGLPYPLWQNREPTESAVVPDRS